MSTVDNIDDITEQIQQLDLEQQNKLDILILKHRRQKLKLLNKFQRRASTKKTATTYSPPKILSHSKVPLERGNRVIIRLKASIGKKGNLALVTHVAAGRVDIYVPRLNNKTWRLPGNLAHCSDKCSK